MKTCNVIIADDHPLLVDGLTKVLEEIDGLKVIATTGNGRELIDLLANYQTDIVLLDLQMPKMDGIDSMKIIRKNYPHIKIIVFTNYGQPKLIREIRSMGACGYLLKNVSSPVLKQAVVAIANGETWFQDLFPEMKQPEILSNEFIRKYQLTERETEIIGKIAKGLTTREIAEELFLSEFTINTHRRNICRKLNIYTPVGIINFAKEHGLVS